MKFTTSFLVLATLGLNISAAPAAALRQPYNILFIASDDLNDWVGAFGGSPQARTPRA